MNRVPSELRAALEVVPGPVLIVSPAGLVVFASERCVEVFGPAAASLVDAPIETFLPERNRRRHGELFVDFFTHPGPRRFGAGMDLCTLSVGGLEIAVEIDVSPVELLGATHAIALVRRVSERRDADVRNRAIVSVLPDLVFVLDREGAIIDWHANDPTLLLRPAREFVGKTLEAVLPASAAASLRRAHENATRGHYSRCEYTLELAGRAQHWEARFAPHLDGTIAVVRDVTEQRAALDALRRQTELLELSQDIGRIGSWEWDLASGRIHWSDGMYRIHGVDRATFVPTPHNVVGLYGRGDADELQRRISHAIVEGGGAAVEGTVQQSARAPDGTTRVFQMSWRLYSDAERIPQRVVGVTLDVTERETQAELLRLSRVAIDSARNGIILCDAEDRVVLVNAAMCEMLAVEPSELTQRSYDDIWREVIVLDRGWAEPMSAHLPAEGVAKRSDGSGLPVELSELRLPGTTYRGIVVRDISERRRAEEELRASRAHYQSLFDEAVEGLFRIAADGTIVDVNRAFGAIVGRTRDELYGMRLADLHDDPEDWQRVLRHLHESGSVQQVELRWRRADRTPVTVEISVHDLPLRQGLLVWRQGFVRDVTEERARASRERFLLQFKELFDAVVEGTRQGFWDWNLETNAVAFSEGWARMLGYETQELEPCIATCRALVHDDDLPRCDAVMREHLGGARPHFESVHRMRHKDGSWRYILSRGKVLARDSLGAPTRFCGTHTDITLEKEAERAALDANRAKTFFLANMSHELRTPLNAVMGLSEALIEGAYGDLNARQQHSLRTVHKSGQHLLDLINDVLDIARVESGKLPVELRDVAVAPLVADAVALVRPDVSKKKQRLLVDLDGAAPYVSGDARRLRQVLINLLTNASKFSPPEATITLGSARASSPGFVDIWVEDTGPGVPAAAVRTIFEPFVRLDDSLSRAQGGAGLGLALVKRIAELHGGTVRVDSLPGHGSRFTVSLPQSQAALRPDPPTSPPIAPSASLARPKRTAPAPLVLLAEDSDANVIAVEGYLSAKGYRVKVARDGVSVLRMLDDELPSVVLMDVELPVLDGLSATRMIRSSGRGAAMPIIVLTAHAMPGDQQRCLAAGASAYLTKPVRLRELVRAIERVLTPELAPS